MGVSPQVWYNTEIANIKDERKIALSKTLVPNKNPHPNSGMGVLEVLLAVVLFVIIFMPLFHLYTVEGLGQQKLIRDYAVAINIAENALNLIENSIERGDINRDFVDEDITPLIFNNPTAQAAIKKMLGDGSQQSTKYMPGFLITLTAKKMEATLYYLELKFSWGREQGGQLKKEHTFTLSTLKCKL